MMSLPLSPAQEDEYYATLTRPHRMRSLVHLMTSSEEYVGSLGGRLLSGQVVADATADVQTSAQMSLLAYKLVRPPRRGDMIRIRREVLTSFGWVGPPLFTGPVASARLTGDVLDLDCLDKSSLLRDPPGANYTFRKGMRRTDVIVSLARARGERRILVPASTSKLAGPLQLRAGESIPWATISHQAGTLSRHVYYNGAGALVTRRPPTQTSWRWTTANVLTLPQVEEDDAETVNAIRVVGKAPAGKKGVVDAKSYLKRDHPLSPQNLGRHGVDRFLWEVITDETIRTKHQAQQRADQRVRELTAETASNVTFSALPVPGIELNDLHRVDVGGVHQTFRVRQYTIPLTADGEMTVGYVAPLRRQKARTRAWR